MTGQMPGGNFDVPELWVTEPLTADTPSEAIPQGGDFTLHAIISGSGTQWNNMKSQAHTFQIYFHLEGIGTTEAEVDYGPVSVTLNPATDSYEVTHTVTANTLPVGLYACGCTAENTNWHGAVGFKLGIVLQIYTP